MACPFFIPLTRYDDAGWLHVNRLPLGAGWRGACAAQPDHIPSDEQCKSDCNLGYAKSCSLLPEDRFADCVRFSIARDRGGVVDVCYVFERDYLPKTRGELSFDVIERRWSTSSGDDRLERLALCFVESYLSRR